MEEIKLKGIKEGAVKDIRLMIADFKVCYVMKYRVCN
jgi:hypothetical protein